MQHIVVSVLWLDFLCSLLAANICNVTYRLSHSNQKNLQDTQSKGCYTVVANYAVLILFFYTNENRPYIKYIRRS
jgi:hypothetical protein